MNQLKIGNIYAAAAHKQGENKNGAWESLTVRDERSKNPITVFVENIPSGVSENGRFRLERITNVSFGKRPVEDGFIAVSSIHAFVTPVLSGSTETSAEEGLI